MKDYKKIFLWEETVVKIPHKKIKSINKIQKLKKLSSPFSSGVEKKKQTNQSRRDSYTSFVQRKTKMKEREEGEREEGETAIFNAKLVY